MTGLKIHLLNKLVIKIELSFLMEFNVSVWFIFLGINLVDVTNQTILLG